MELARGLRAGWSSHKLAERGWGAACPPAGAFYDADKRDKGWGQYNRLYETLNHAGYSPIV